MPHSRRNSQQTLALKIELAEAKVAKTRAAHEKAVDELKNSTTFARNNSRSSF